MRDLLAILPVVIPLAGAAAGLCLTGWPRAQRWLCFAAMAAGFVAAGVLLREVMTSGEPVVFAGGGWRAPFGIVFVGDLLGATMTAVSLLVMTAGMGYALGCKDKCVNAPTFFPLFLTLAAGLNGGILTGDIFNLFVFTELVVISGAALTALSDDKYGVEAAYKYFYISILAGVFLLLAAGSLYAVYGTLNVADLAQRIAARPEAPLAGFALVCLLAYCFVKSAVVPFHFWQPDFHTAAPTPVHAVLSSVVVKLGVVWLLRMTTVLFPVAMDPVRPLLVVLGVAGIFFGGLGATGTNDAKRMLAYSTMGQIGFILVGIGWGTPLALTAAVVYAVNHSLAKAALLMLAGSVASRAPVKTANFEMITGLGRAMPLGGVLFLLGGMALAGVPVSNGFISKLLVFQSGMAAGQVVTLLVIGAGSVISLVYVGRAFQRIWWAELPAAVTPKPKGDRLIAPLALVGLCVALGLYAAPLVELATATANQMLQPVGYGRAVWGD